MLELVLGIVIFSICLVILLVDDVAATFERVKTVLFHHKPEEDP